MHYTDFIVEVLERASAIARRSFGNVSGTTKPEDNNQVLTETDIEIGNGIVKMIQARYPEHNVIDEEAGVIDNKSIYTWVVDPIDGTSNFANGLPMYGVMVGLLKNATPIAGGIALPSFNQIYVASKDGGTFCNGSPIHVSNESALLKALVADGRYGGYLNRTSKIWDNVAPHIIIEEAGGVFTDFFGRPIDYTNPLSKVDENFTMCAAPPKLHKQLQQIIHSSQATAS